MHSATPPLPDIDGERALWAAVLEEAVENAQGRGFSLGWWEIADARDFLRTLTRMGPVCEAIDINPEWLQAHLREQYPEIFVEPEQVVIEAEPKRVVAPVEVQWLTL